MRDIAGDNCHGTAAGHTAASLPGAQWGEARSTDCGGYLTE
jgi:hypothetical protein